MTMVFKSQKDQFGEYVEKKSKCLFIYFFKKMNYFGFKLQTTKKKKKKVMMFRFDDI